MVISRVLSRVTIVITCIRGLITPLISTHEPPSRVWGLRVLVFCKAGIDLCFWSTYGGELSA